MSTHDIASQIRQQIFNRGISLQKFLALADLATSQGGAHGCGNGGKGAGDERENRMRLVRELQKNLDMEILASKNPDAGEQGLFSDHGQELLAITTRFFDELHALVQSAHQYGRSIRVASGTTLAQWLLSPSILMLREKMSALGLVRQPELAFPEINRDELQPGLVSHRFHYAILRHANDLDVMMMDKHFDEAPADIIARWASWDDAEYDAWSRSAKNPFRKDPAVSHRRLGVVLGRYEYTTFLRRGRQEELEQLAKKQRRNWTDYLEVALCTNHPEFSTRLCEFETLTGVRVVVRTDSWAESAHLAMHGGYATLLPSIVRHAMPELVPVDLKRAPKHQEEVVLIFNPTILRTRIFRQMLEVIALSVSATLEGPGVQKPVAPERSR